MNICTKHEKLAIPRTLEMGSICMHLKEEQKNNFKYGACGLHLGSGTQIFLQLVWDIQAVKTKQ